MVGIFSNAGSRVGQRASTVKGLATREVTVLRNAVGDVRSRVGATTADNQPINTENMGGILGKRGSLIKTPFKIVADTVDNIAQFVQENAAITRKTIKRSG